VRMGGTAKAGPVVTDNSNFVVDAIFGPIQHPAELNMKLQSIPGVVDTGLFIHMATECFVGNEDGTVYSIKNPKAQTQLDFAQQQEQEAKSSQ